MKYIGVCSSRAPGMSTPTPIHDAAVLCLTALAEFWGLGVLAPADALGDDASRDAFYLAEDGPNTVEILEEVVEECQALETILEERKTVRDEVGNLPPEMALDLLCKLVDLAQECRDKGRAYASERQVDTETAFDTTAKDAWAQLNGRYRWWGHGPPRVLLGSDFRALQAQVEEARASRGTTLGNKENEILPPWLPEEHSIAWMQILQKAMRDVAGEVLPLIREMAAAVRRTWFREADTHFDLPRHRQFDYQCMAYVLNRRQDYVIEKEQRPPQRPIPQSLQARNELLQDVLVQRHLIVSNLVRRNRILYAQEERGHAVYSAEQMRAIRERAFKDPGEAWPAPPAAGYLRGFYEDRPDELCVEQISTHGLTCPGCLEVQRPEVARSFEAWNAHIAEDLCPYICLDPQCRDPVFSSPSADGCAWKEHMLNEHCSKLSACPFCSWPPNPEEVDPEHLLAHIAIELQFFALLALPWATRDLQKKNAFKQWYDLRYPGKAVDSPYYPVELPQLQYFYEDCSDGVYEELSSEAETEYVSNFV
ncbi:uncharacterized protein BO66DRAFT_406152 [Aspergillus aculeatinus CBS 121060]|uniref:Uncharacterized protein n=1 Tax=Aspergillus aculeatinus CBS 121060 TaxID=1448322 RepID=A0ACD1GTM0_9EURO|nr:hypothetical protein BO66DRAFT_406152 [Aspergillus aculeatinus CBS 121060]RAH64685.1 hypothetical protein BO66DRAFT_406152 [Aspergillus aculeatinus CBS 121060]